MMITTDDTALREILTKVARASLKTDFELLTHNARKLLKLVAYETPYVTGSGRAGWWPSWRALGMAGSPYTKGRQYEPKTIGKRTKRDYYPDGSIDDQRHVQHMASVTFRNNTYVRYKGRRTNYLYLSTVRGKNSGWLDLAKKRAVWEWEKHYDRLLAKANRGSL